MNKDSEEADEDPEETVEESKKPSQVEETQKRRDEPVTTTSSTTTTTSTTTQTTCSVAREVPDLGFWTRPYSYNRVAESRDAAYKTEYTPLYLQGRRYPHLSAEELDLLEQASRQFAFGSNGSGDNTLPGQSSRSYEPPIYNPPSSQNIADCSSNYSSTGAGDIGHVGPSQWSLNTGCMEPCSSGSNSSWGYSSTYNPSYMGPTPSRSNISARNYYAQDYRDPNMYPDESANWTTENVAPYYTRNPMEGFNSAQNYAQYNNQNYSNEQTPIYTTSGVPENLNPEVLYYSRVRTVEETNSVYANSNYNMQNVNWDRYYNPNSTPNRAPINPQVDYRYQNPNYPQSSSTSFGPTSYPNTGAIPKIPNFRQPNSPTHYRFRSSNPNNSPAHYAPSTSYGSPGNWNTARENYPYSEHNPRGYIPAMQAQYTPSTSGGSPSNWNNQSMFYPNTGPTPRGYNSSINPSTSYREHYYPTSVTTEPYVINPTNTAIYRQNQTQMSPNWGERNVTNYNLQDDSERNITQHYSHMGNYAMQNFNPPEGILEICKSYTDSQSSSTTETDSDLYELQQELRSLSIIHKQEEKKAREEEKKKREEVTETISKPSESHAREQQTRENISVVGNQPESIQNSLYSNLMPVKPLEASESRETVVTNWYDIVTDEVELPDSRVNPERSEITADENIQSSRTTTPLASSSSRRTDEIADPFPPLLQTVIIDRTRKVSKQSIRSKSANKDAQSKHSIEHRITSSHDYNLPQVPENRGQTYYTPNTGAIPKTPVTFAPTNSNYPNTGAIPRIPNIRPSTQSMPNTFQSTNPNLFQANYATTSSRSSENWYAMREMYHNSGDFHREYNRSVNNRHQNSNLNYSHVQYPPTMSGGSPTNWNTQSTCYPNTGPTPRGYNSSINSSMGYRDHNYPNTVPVTNEPYVVNPNTIYNQSPTQMSSGAMPNWSDRNMPNYYSNARNVHMTSYNTNYPTDSRRVDNLSPNTSNFQRPYNVSPARNYPNTENSPVQGYNPMNYSADYRTPDNYPNRNNPSNMPREAPNYPSMRTINVDDFNLPTISEVRSSYMYTHCSSNSTVGVNIHQLQHELHTLRSVNKPEETIQPGQVPKIYNTSGNQFSRVPPGNENIPAMGNLPGNVDNLFYPNLMASRPIEASESRETVLTHWYDMITDENQIIFSNSTTQRSEIPLDENMPLSNRSDPSTARTIPLVSSSSHETDEFPTLLQTMIIERTRKSTHSLRSKSSKQDIQTRQSNIEPSSNIIPVVATSSQEFDEPVPLVLDTITVRRSSKKNKRQRKRKNKRKPEASGMEVPFKELIVPRSDKKNPKGKFN